MKELLGRLLGYLAPLHAIAHELGEQTKLMRRRNELLEAELREKGVYVPDPEVISRFTKEEKEVELMYGSKKPVFKEEEY